MIFWKVQSKPSLCDLLHFEIRPVKFTKVTVEHTPKSIAYLRAAYREIRLAYVMTFCVKFIYANSSVLKSEAFASTEFSEIF